MTIDQMLDRIGNPASYPTATAVAGRTLQQIARSDLSATGLAEVLREDPALLIKVLRMANASGPGCDFVDLEQAVDAIGLHGAKLLALSFSLTQTDGSAGDDELDCAALWQRSLARALTCEAIANALHPELMAEAFAAGLLAEAGLLAAWQAAPEILADVFRQQPATPTALADMETEQFGWNHAELTAALLRTDNMPEAVCAAVESQFNATPDTPLAGILQAALAIADGATDQVADLLGIEAEAVGAFVATAEQAATTAEARLQLPPELAGRVGQLQSDAAMQMAMLSLASEAERFQADRAEEAARAEGARLNQETKRILEAASTDSLTQIANRAAFDKRLDEELARAVEHDEKMALLIMDVDFFKKFNDTHGHRAGDEVLRRVAEQLQAGAPGFAARYGGEEFAVILSHKSAGRANDVAEQLRAAIEATTVPWNGQALQVTASFGVAIVRPGVAIAAADLIEQADQQLYAAKRAGRNRVLSVTVQEVSV